jgi:hypothetical protein
MKSVFRKEYPDFQSSSNVRSKLSGKFPINYPVYAQFRKERYRNIVCNITLNTSLLIRILGKLRQPLYVVAVGSYFDVA